MFKVSTLLDQLRDVVAQWFSASDLGPEGGELEPWSVHPRGALKQNT